MTRRRRKGRRKETHTLRMDVWIPGGNVFAYVPAGYDGLIASKY